MAIRFPVATALLAIASGQPLLAAEPQAMEPVRAAVDTMQAIPTARPKEADTSDFLIVPIPLVSPALGTGITLGAARFYNPNGSKEPWTTGAALMATTNGSWAVGAGHKMAWAQDRFRLTAFAGYADVNVRFYGIGSSAGSDGRSVDTNDSGFLGFVDPQMRVAPNLYVGMRAFFLDLKVSLRREEEEGEDVELPPARELNSRLVQVGPVMVYDSRDSSLYPKKGVYAQASWLAGVPGLSSDFGSDRLTMFANVYQPIGPRTTFAARVSTCAVSTDTPFYDLCFYGSASDLRGYEAGQYRDRALWATQAEIRHQLKGRFGIAAFAGVGGIAPSFGEIGSSSTVLPAVGAGVRWQPSKETPINLRIDFAVGKDSNALYVSVGEAF